MPWHFGEFSILIRIIQAGGNFSALLPFVQSFPTSPHTPNRYGSKLIIDAEITGGDLVTVSTSTLPECLSRPATTAALHIPLYSALLRSTILYPTIRYSTLHYSTLLYSTPLSSTPLYTTLHYTSLLYSTLLLSLLFSALLCYSALLHSTLLYPILLYSSLL